jgi:hypothetical protein
MPDSNSGLQDTQTRPQVKQDIAGQKQHQPKKVVSAPQVVKESTSTESPLQFNQGNLIQGVIWAEILGKPKAKRSRR